MEINNLLMDELDLDFSGSIISPDQSKDTVTLLKEFLENYLVKSDLQKAEEWLHDQMVRHLPGRSVEEIKTMGEEIFGTLRKTEEMRQSLRKAVEMGRDKNSWLASVLNGVGGPGVKALLDMRSGIIGANKSLSEMIGEKVRGFMPVVDWEENPADDAKDVALDIAGFTKLSTLQDAVSGTGLGLAEKVLEGVKLVGGEKLAEILESGDDLNVKAVMAGALKTASENGLLAVLPSGTATDVISSISFMGMEKIKTVIDAAKGVLNGRNVFEVLEEGALSVVANIGLSAKGAALGAKIGAIFGPVGTTIGGFVGGVAGNFVETKVLGLVKKGVQKVKGFAVKAVQTVKTKVKEGLKAAGRAIARIFGG